MRTPGSGSLHEIAVAGRLISQHGQDLAERYLLHDTIERYKLALRYQEYAKQINEELIPQEDFDRLTLKRDELVARFGNAFKEDYGWAASAIGTEHPTIRDIERHVDLDWGPYYRIASDNVHANAHGTYYRLGLNPRASEVLLAGPSEVGLAAPGHSTALSLSQITTALLATRSNLDCLVLQKLLPKLVEEIGGAFLEVHNEFEALAKIDS